MPKASALKRHAEEDAEKEEVMAKAFAEVETEEETEKEAKAEAQSESEADEEQEAKDKDRVLMAIVQLRDFVDSWEPLAVWLEASVRGLHKWERRMERERDMDMERELWTSSSSEESLE